MRYLPLLLFLFQPALVFSQQRPLVTERAETVPRGHILFDIGLEFLQDAVFAFSGLEGDLTRIGVLGARIGVADNVELQVASIGFRRARGLSFWLPAPYSISTQSIVIRSIDPL